MEFIRENPVMWGGVGGTFPIKEGENNIKIWSSVLLGGPIASIIMGGMFLGFCFINFNIIWLLLGLMPISMGVVCLLPLKTGITYTDGKRWHRLRSGGQDQAEEIAIFKMTEFEQFGKDKSTIQKEDFEALLSAELPALRYYGNYYLFQYYIAHNDEENKANTLEVLNNMKTKVSKIIVDDCPLYKH
jgi:hypothetical protein